jgi:hypothetical protein
MSDKMAASMAARRARSPFQGKYPGHEPIRRQARDSGAPPRGALRPGLQRFAQRAGTYGRSSTSVPRVCEPQRPSGRYHRAYAPCAASTHQRWPETWQPGAHLKCIRKSQRRAANCRDSFGEKRSRNARPLLRAPTAAYRREQLRIVLTPRGLVTEVLLRSEA